jgi:hypothetical protein
MPVGPIDNLNPKIGVDVTDPSGINEVRLKYKINGGTEQTIILTASGWKSRSL